MNSINKDEYTELSKKCRNEFNSRESRICKLCGKKVNSFCNSHNIPSKILQNIAYDNQLVSFFKGSDTGEKEDYGYKNAGIFKCICRECDGNLFQLYENRTEDDIRVKGYNQEMMNLIALKCNLFLYCEYTIEKNIIKELLQQKMEVFRSEFKRKNVYLTEIENDIKLFYSNILRETYDDLKMIFSYHLDYVIPIAYQGMIVPEGYRDIEIYLCLFPLKNSSHVLVFCKNQYYEKAKTIFNPSNKKKNISILSKLTILNLESYYFHKSVFEKFTDAEKEKFDKLRFESMLVENNDISKYNKKIKSEMYKSDLNILSERFKLKKKDE